MAKQVRPIRMDDELWEAICKQAAILRRKPSVFVRNEMANAVRTFLPDGYDPNNDVEPDEPNK